MDAELYREYSIWGHAIRQGEGYAAAAPSRETTGSLRPRVCWAVLRPGMRLNLLASDGAERGGEPRLVRRLRLSAECYWDAPITAPTSEMFPRTSRPDALCLVVRAADAG